MAKWRSLSKLCVWKRFLIVGLAILFLMELGRRPVNSEEPSTPAGGQVVPPLQVDPQPYDQAVFRYLPLDRELTRFHFGSQLHRPFLYPVIGPSGKSLTRMGHPHDPVSHSHHNSVWISHVDVNQVDFWSDKPGPQIICRRVVEYGERPTTAADGQGFAQAWLVAEIDWLSATGTILLREERRLSVIVLASAEEAWRAPDQVLARGYLIVFDLSFRPGGKEPVVFGETPFGLIGVRMTKTIGVRDGGGRILNSEGDVNEKAAFRKPARWVDYSGPLTPSLQGGITLFDHPDNPGYPNPFHVRDDGWMGICLTLGGPLTVDVGKTLALRYILWCHDGVPQREKIEEIARLVIGLGTQERTQ